MKPLEFEEKRISRKNGIPMLVLVFVLILVGTLLIVVASNFLANFSFVLGGILLSLGIIILLVDIIAIIPGIKSVNPNEAAVFTLFGNYYATIVEPGLYYVNPFVTAVKDKTSPTVLGGKDKNSYAIGALSSSRISLKTRSLNNERQKVNDLLGNPIIIETVVIWRVVNPNRAVFNVDNYFEYLSTQCDSIVRNVARLYPYDNLEYDGEPDSELTLMSSSQKIAEQMMSELQAKVENAGIVIEDMRISHLSYSDEIAAAMLQRQQASAIVAARSKIVEGAVGMVELALEDLDNNDLIALDEERKAQMVSNLLVVLCGTRDVQPVVNSGSIY
ncbi:MAG: SPFH domain-containing protein [Coriobacteriia bacterium]|nr:SPFH domain-containing protein [Coriobacteriia bacterium]